MKSILETDLKPICFLCNKEVDEIENQFDFRTNEHIVKVKCHNDEETNIITQDFLIFNKIERICFLSKKII